MKRDIISSREIASRVQKVLEDMKGDDILVIEIQEISSIADFLVIASGGVGRKVIAMADAVCDVLRECQGAGADKPKVEGRSQGDWVVVDGSDVVIHLQRSEVREYYKIEDMWLERVEKFSRGDDLSTADNLWTENDEE